MKNLSRGGIIPGILGVAVLAALGMWFFGSNLPGKSHSVSPTRRPAALAGQYEMAAVRDYYIPAAFEGKPWVLASEDMGDTLTVHPGDLIEYRVLEGSCLPNKAMLCEFFHPRAYPELFPNGIRYARTTTWSKPHPVPWFKGDHITPETAPFVADPVFMPRSQGPDNPFIWKFADLNLPWGFPMIGIRPKYPFGRQWYREGVGLADSTGWLTVQQRGPLALYLNYDFGAESVEWNALRMPTGLSMKNEGFFRVRIVLWRPEETKSRG